MNEKKNCFGCDYFYPVEELTFQFADQYGEVSLCNECINKEEERENNE
jgi:hypothetical protein